MSAEATEPGTSSDAGNVPTQLTSLVPSFDPTQDDLEQYVQKVEMLCEIWPSNKLSELATCLILNAKGAAFQKLQLKRKEVIIGSTKGIKQLVEILGGHWGRYSSSANTKWLNEQFSAVPRSKMSQMTRT